jgi:hypothetical protein
MNRRMLAAFAAGIGLLTLTSGGASAQFYARPFVYGGYFAPPRLLPAPIPHAPVTLDAREILADVAEQGYRPIGVVSNRGDIVVVDAISRRNVPVRLVVDAYDGEILELFPRGTALEPGRRAPAKASKAQTTLAEAPRPPRRPAPAVGAAPGTARPTPVAPARDPSQWAPLTPVPVAPLE